MLFDHGPGLLRDGLGSGSGPSGGIALVDSDIWVECVLECLWERPIGPLTDPISPGLPSTENCKMGQTERPVGSL